MPGKKETHVMNVEKGGLPGLDVWMGEAREQQSGFC